MAAAERIVERAKADGIRATVTIGTAFGCPFEGAVDPGRVAELAGRVAGVGADEIVVADTVGVGVPRQVRDLVGRIGPFGVPIGIHLHNTRNTGFANAFAALEAGATVLDASVGGIGGCPFAPRATGNIATEDLVYLLHGEGVETGIDLDALIAVAKWLEITARAGARGSGLQGRHVRSGRRLDEERTARWRTGWGSTSAARSPTSSSFRGRTAAAQLPRQDAVDAGRPVRGRAGRRAADLRRGRHRRRTTCATSSTARPSRRTPCSSRRAPASA